MCTLFKFLGGDAYIAPYKMNFYTQDTFNATASFYLFLNS